MTYSAVSHTVLDPDLGLILAITITIALLVAVAVIIALSRPHRSRGASTLFLLVIAGSWIVGSGTAAEAATSDGATEPGSVTLIQTSAMENLAPGIPPVIITGLIINNGTEEVSVTAVDVKITSVIRAIGAAPGVCGASDYVLLDTRMPVGRTVAAEGGTTIFSGASIGFNNTSTNQDACQGATVSLLYTTVDAVPMLGNTGIDPSLRVVLGIGIVLMIAGAVLIGLARSHSARGASGAPLLPMVDRRCARPSSPRARAR
jgi:hypothetical protein